MDPTILYYTSSSDSDETVTLNTIRKKIRGSADPLNLPNNDFKRRFRLTKEALNYLLGQLNFEAQLSTAVPPKIQLAATLVLLASGGFQHSVGNDFLWGLAKVLCAILQN